MSNQQFYFQQRRNVQRIVSKYRTVDIIVPIYDGTCVMIQSFTGISEHHKLNTQTQDV